MSIEQLSMASEREILHELSERVEAYPLTTQRLAEELGPYNYEDVSRENPPKTRPTWKWKWIRMRN